MEKNVAIFGASMMASQMKYFIETDKGKKVIGFIVDDQYYKEGQEFCNCPVYPFSTIENYISNKTTSVLFGIGMAKMNKERERIFFHLKEKGFELESYISPKASIYTKKIGEGNIILTNAIIAPNVEVGDGNFFDMSVTIAHDCRIGNFNFFAASASLSGDVTVGKGCFFGNNSSVRNSVVVSNYTLVGAGAYLDKNTKENSIFVPTRGLFLKPKMEENTNGGGGLKTLLDCPLKTM